MTLSLAEFAARCRAEEVAGFLNLRKLLHSDIEAAKALRSEMDFVQSVEFRALNAPQDEAFALKVRTQLLANKLEWNFENLLTTTIAVLAVLRES